MEAATHSHGEVIGTWSLSGPPRRTSHRIYRGSHDSVLLTVQITNPIPPGTAKIRILANGTPVSDAILTKTSGPVSRTWRLTNVTTIDIVSLENIYMNGEYVISVLFRDRESTLITYSPFM